MTVGRDAQDLELASAIDGAEARRAPPAEVEEQRAVQSLLATLPAALPDPGLADDVMRRLRELRPAGVAGSDESARAGVRRAFRRGFVAAAAVMVVALGGGVAVWSILRPPQPGATQVTLRLSAPGASTVAVVGDFNEWQDQAHRLSDDDHDGVWTITFDLAPGRYEYAFVVDGSRWIADPRAVRYRPDGFGGRNALLDL